MDNRPFGWYSVSMENRRQLILTEASRIIAEDGMDSFSLSLLAGKSGITKATLYNYFTSKDEIFTTIIEEGHRTFMKNGFRLDLSGDVNSVLLRAAEHWVRIFNSEESILWLRIIFSMHLVNDLCHDEYRSITLMLSSQAGVVISSFGLPQSYTSTLTRLFSSLLLVTLEKALEDEEDTLERDVKGVAELIESVRGKRK